MSSKFDQLHIYFFPHMAPGHMIPLVDMARQFARHSVKATIVMTALNATNFSKTIQRDAKLGLHISIRQVEFPTCGTGLPEGCENLASTTTSEMSTNFYKALEMLQKPLEQIINEDRPDCLVADFFYPWATQVASKFGIPRLVFHGIGVFPLCVYHSLNRNDPYTNIESNSETFIVPDLPDTIKITRLQLPDHSREKCLSDFANIIKRARNSEHTSFGVIVNSFHELEPAYPETYQQFIGRRAWLVGPVSLCNKNKEDKAQRGYNVSFDENECLNWLNSKPPNSVLYICFGSMSLFPAPQLHEIAIGLEASGQQFIWVVKKEKGEEQEEWLPKGYEKRIEKKGLIIRGWAPQVLILDHVAVGGFVTHCGWNSLLEGVAAGVPMVTWPLFAEQFYNEKLITDVLKIGVAVGSQQWSNRSEEYKVSVKGNDIANAVTQLMLGQEAYDMRCRARALGDAANKSVEKGGSSYTDLNNLLDELRMKRP